MVPTLRFERGLSDTIANKRYLRVRTVELAMLEDAFKRQFSFSDTLVDSTLPFHIASQAQHTKFITILRIDLEVQVLIPNRMLPSLNVDLGALSTAA